MLKSYEELKKMDLSVDMTRGKPCQEQLALSNGMFDIFDENSDFVGVDDVDVRNYGLLPGITEARELMAAVMDESVSNTLVLGSSALQNIYDTISRCMQFGAIEGKPWNECEKVKFLCPAPGYDRHFDICENFGIEMINIEMHEDGPDVDKIASLCEADESIKGIFCVPQYSNPTGVTYSDEVVDALASMKAASDFRIFWDNAYCVHHLYCDDKEIVKDIGDACKKFGNEDRYFKFASFSKVTFPGASIAGFASSENNIKHALLHLSKQMIGSDKINQLRHVRFLNSLEALEDHMRKHAEIIRPKFELIERKLRDGLGDNSDCSWSNPKGGYFISFDTPKGCASRTVEIALDLGVTLQKSGSTFPYKRDENDSNIRIAPTMPTLEDLDSAIDVLICAVKLAINEQN